MSVKSQSVCRRILFRAAFIAVLVINLVNVCSAQTRANGPCDIYAAATPCVAAFSTTRALYSSYAGSLYQVARQSDNTTANIGILSDGYANAAAQIHSAPIPFARSPKFTINRPSITTSPSPLLVVLQAVLALVVKICPHLQIRCR